MTQIKLKRVFGISWSYGVTVGFEFFDVNLMGGGWALHLGICKLMCIYVPAMLDD